MVLGIPGLIYAILIALGSTTFVISIENTYVANTLIMIALLPFATAILSSIFLKEHPSKRMWLTIIACFAVVLFIFYDSYQGNRLACGKNNLHNLEPEDLCALTVESAAMARVPLAGTSWIPGSNN